MLDMDDALAAAFRNGDPATLEDLGGPDFLRGREGAVARTPFMPEVLRLVVVAISGGNRDECLGKTVLACLSVQVGYDEGVEPEAWKDAVEALAGSELPEDLAADAMDVLVARVRSAAENEVARWVALAASLEIALMHPDTRHDLVGALVRLKVDARHPRFLRRVAKVAGILNSHWPDTGLAKLLGRLAEIPEARDEASFELGMSYLRRGLEAGEIKNLEDSFQEARAHFDAALMVREHRPDAVAYRGALSILQGVRRGDGAKELRDTVHELAQAVWCQTGWLGTAGAPWRWSGAPIAELVRWQDLADRLVELADGFPEAGGPDPTPEIRRRLLEAYVANRAVLGSAKGGVDVVLRPVVEGKILMQDRVRESVATWLAYEAESGDDDWRQTAGELLDVVRRGSPPGKHLGMSATTA